MSVQDFLNRIEATGLVNPALMTELRKRVTESKRRLRPEMIAKLLVDRGELTAAQARKLVIDSANAPTAIDEEEDILTGEPAAPSYNDDLDLVGDAVAPDVDVDELDSLEIVDEVDETPEAILIEDEASTPAETATQAAREESLGDLLDGPLVQDESRTIRRRGSLFSQLFGGKSKGGRAKRWDSPLILLGGGGLVLMIAAAVGIFLLLYSESVDELYTAADEAYQSQAYGVAIENFQRLATKYPQNENASISRVRIELSKLRMHSESSQADWAAALRQAEQGLPNVSGEEAFSTVRPELAKLLPDITGGLVDQSSKSDSTDQKKGLLDLAVQSLELVHNPTYLPTTVKRTQELRIEGIEAQIDAVRRDIQREEALAGTAQQIVEAAAAGRIVEAYRFRDDLVAKYPILLGNATLNDALSNVTNKERGAVQVTDSKLRPSTEEHPPVSRIKLVLADQRGEPVSGVTNQIVSILARGAVYALDAADGSIRWRRFVGLETSVSPQPIKKMPGSDVLLVDGAHNELQRVDAKTGVLQWRLACPAPLSQPKIVGERIYLCSGSDADSRLLAVDAESGQVVHEVQFPVGCQTPPGLLNNGKLLGIVGMHSSVYILDTETLACTAVIPSGHRRDSIVTSPVWIGGMVMLAENTGNTSAKLRLFQPVDEGKWTPTGEAFSMVGRIVSPIQIDAQRVMIHSDRGAIRVFEVPLNSKQLREIAALDAGDIGLGVPQAQLFGSEIWIADQKLSRYQLQATRGELVPQWVRDQRDRFQGPLHRFGDYIYSVRQRNRMLGVTVAAHPVNQNRGEPVWQTDLAVPSEILVTPANSVHAVTANGAMFPIDSKAVKAGITNRRTARIDTRLLPAAFAQSFSAGPNQTVFASPPPNKYAVVADLANAALNRIPLRIDTDIASTPLVAFNNGILAACETGPIHWLDHQTGKQMAAPFVPRIEPGNPIRWLPPAKLDDQQFIAAERRGQLYLVARQGEQLVVSKEATVDSPLVAGLAGLGQHAFGVITPNGQDEIIAIDAQLQVSTLTALNAGVVWGPERIDSQVMATDGEHTLYTFDSTGKLAWQAKLAGPLAGRPLQQGNTLLVATTNGQVAKLDRATGNVMAQQKFPEPLGGGLIGFKGKLLVVSWDGTLYLVDVPQ